MTENEEYYKESPLRPVHVNTFALPNDAAAKLAFKIYNPAQESLELESEKGRTIFAEAFITNPRLGTLADLCIRALTAEYGASNLPFVPKNNFTEQLQLEALDIETPLEDIYHIEDQGFWRRVALAKTKDVALKLKPADFDWKSEGVTLKYIEIVENSSAEFCNEKTMGPLAMNIKDFVKHVHIRQLQSMKDFSFDRYLVRDSETDKTTSSDVSSTTDDEQNQTGDSVSKQNDVENADGLQVQKQESQERVVFTDLKEPRSLFDLPPASSSSLSESISVVGKEELVFENTRLNEKLRRKTEERRKERRARRKAQELRRAKREHKRELRDAKANKPKPKRIKVKNVYDLPIDESEDEEAKILDKRNLERFLAHKKSYKYPPEHCHHADLRFLEHLENLVSFAIEFNPPPLECNYHTRHFNFSLRDVEQLASGISNLQKLRTFRLRDSRMDDNKLEALTAVLSHLNVETVDFGNDELNDNCDDALFQLFQNTSTIASLELEGNKLGICTLRRLGKALKYYDGRLCYLGLARNPIESDSLHALCSKIYDTPQVEKISLAGIRLSEMAIICCIADELLHRHTALRYIDLMGVPLWSTGGQLIARSMRTNYNVQYFDCRGCNLEQSLEEDIAMCVQRNQYMVKHGLDEDIKKTAEHFQEKSEEKHHILRSADEIIKEHRACFENRPDVAERFTSGSYSSNKRISATVTAEQTPNFDENSSNTFLTEPIKEPFVFNPNEFTKEQFYQHVNVPGPGNRYFYFQSIKSNVHCENID